MSIRKICEIVRIRYKKSPDNIPECKLKKKPFNILFQIGDNGMPDKYLVTHVLTKDVKNEDLRDFLQESIEECFQILDNGMLILIK